MIYDDGAHDEEEEDNDKEEDKNLTRIMTNTKHNYGTMVMRNMTKQRQK